MVNTDALERKIKSSGYTKTHIAQQLGMSIQTLRLKTTNQKEFKCSEAGDLKKLLKLTPTEATKIFFN